MKDAVVSYPSPSRRTFIGWASMAAAGASFASPLRALGQEHSPFKLGVITDGISDNFEHACAVAAKEFGLEWVALRSLWNRSIIDLDSGDISRALAILKKHKLRVSYIAGPLFKVDWPGAPRSKFTRQSAANTDFSHQHNVLARCLALAQQFNTDKIRCFDFWRLDDVAPHRAGIDDFLRTAADTTAKQGIQLVVENDYECNTATGAEAARLLHAVPGLMFNWDPANAAKAGELDAFPAGWELLPKDRIRHCFCKNVARNAADALEWSPVDAGLIDWTAQFRALKDAGFSDAISLEAPKIGAATQESSSRSSWAGMKRALEASGTL